MEGGKGSREGALVVQGHLIASMQELDPRLRVFARCQKTGPLSPLILLYSDKLTQRFLLTFPV